MSFSRDELRAAYEAACRREIEALKPGNVHVFADGHRMSADQFLTSAEVSSGPLTDPGLPVGRRILEAVRATRKAVDTNTNLGIVLLCAPLAQAALALRPAPLRERLALVLAALDVQDAHDAFGAIARANPGGLGDEPAADVRAPAQIPLGAAMALAAHRDMIARQYAGGFAEVFAIGVPPLHGAPLAPARLEDVFLAFLAGHPDSHIARKFGPDAAEAVRAEAEVVRHEIEGLSQQARHGRLLAFDARLKAGGRNPGTSADLTVASCFAAQLLAAEAAQAQAQA
jgi:triphosphoribosyl-dephospho-CoA synthase